MSPDVSEKHEFKSRLSRLLYSTTFFCIDCSLLYTCFQQTKVSLVKHRVGFSFLRGLCLVNGLRLFAAPVQHIEATDEQIKKPSTETIVKLIN